MDSPHKTRRKIGPRSTPTGGNLAHASILGAACVGFSLTVLFSLDGTSGEDPRSAAVWDRVVASIGEMASDAEAAGMDIAAHPHQLGPLYTVEQIARLLREVGSPRLRVAARPGEPGDFGALLRHDPVPQRCLRYARRETSYRYTPRTPSSPALQRNDQGLLTVCRLNEAVPGKGNLDYATLLRRADALDHDVVMHVEHLSLLDDKVVAFHNIRQVAREQGITLA